MTVNVQQDEKGTSKLSREEEELESLKTECNDAGCKIQSLQAETESIRALVGQLSQSVMQKKIIKHNDIQSTELCTIPDSLQKRGLENALNDAKNWHGIELQNLGSVIGKLEGELNDIRGDIEQQRRDYETLHNDKMKLELEIGTYHGILDGEESRFHSST